MTRADWGRAVRRATERLRDLGELLSEWVDLRDLHFYGGLALAMIGGWQLSSAGTMIAAGVVLMAIGLLPGGRT